MVCSEAGIKKSAQEVGAVYYKEKRHQSVFVLPGHFGRGEQHFNAIWEAESGKSKVLLFGGGFVVRSIS